MTLNSGTAQNGEWRVSFTTSIVGTHSVRFYIDDSSSNRLQTGNELEFEATAIPSSSAPSSGGGGGGGGSTTIIEKTDIELEFKPALISTNFLYFPFQSINQTFSIEIEASKTLLECSSELFDCEIQDDKITFVVSRKITNDTSFIISYEDKIDVRALDDEAGFINTKLTVINFGHFLSIDAPKVTDNQYLVKTDELSNIVLLQ